MIKGEARGKKKVGDFLPYRGVTVGCDPHACKVVGINFVLYKLAPPLLVDVDPPRLAVVDLAPHHRGVGVRLHLKACYAIPMNITVLKVTLEKEGKTTIYFVDVI